MNENEMLYDALIVEGWDVGLRVWDLRRNGEGLIIQKWVK